MEKSEIVKKKEEVKHANTTQSETFETTKSENVKHEKCEKATAKQRGTMKTKTKMKNTKTTWTHEKSEKRNTD